MSYERLSLRNIRFFDQAGAQTLNKAGLKGGAVKTFARFPYNFHAVMTLPQIA